MRKVSVGIVGGLGPETTAEFYLAIVKRFRENCDSYPSITMDNVPFPFHLEKDIIQESRNEEKLLPFLKESIRRLDRSRVSFIVVPCNTVHIFLKELEEESSVPVIDIIKETVNFVDSNRYKRIGLLATKKTVDSRLYENPLIGIGVETILPTEGEQTEISEIIVRILENKAGRTEEDALNSIISRLAERGAEAALLGCTDLQLILKRNKSKIPLIDSMEILKESTFERLLRGEMCQKSS